MDRQNMDPFWDQVEKELDDAGALVRLKCKHCLRFFYKKTSISRIKWHLSGEKGRGVAICTGQVPREVQEAAFQAMCGGKKRQKSIASSSNVSFNVFTNLTGGLVQPVAGTSSSVLQETTEWTLLMTNLLLEGISAIFDQLGYALLGMVTAIVALVLATVDLFRIARNETITWDGKSLLPCFRHDSSTRKLFGTVVEFFGFFGIAEYFGFFGAVWQCFYSTMEYAYASKNKDNPIKMCLLPFIFLVCVIVSRKTKQAHKTT